MSFIAALPGDAQLAEARRAAQQLSAFAAGVAAALARHSLARDTSGGQPPASPAGLGSSPSAAHAGPATAADGRAPDGAAVLPSLHALQHARPCLRLAMELSGPLAAVAALGPAAPVAAAEAGALLRSWRGVAEAVLAAAADGGAEGSASGPEAMEC